MLRTGFIFSGFSSHHLLQPCPPPVRWFFFNLVLRFPFFDLIFNLDLWLLHHAPTSDRPACPDTPTADRTACPDTPTADHVQVISLHAPQNSKNFFFWWIVFSILIPFGKKKFLNFLNLVISACFSIRIVSGYNRSIGAVPLKLGYSVLPKK